MLLKQGAYYIFIDHATRTATVHRKTKSWPVSWDADTVAIKHWQRLPKRVVEVLVHHILRPPKNTGKM